MQVKVDVSNEILEWVISHIRMEILSDKIVNYLESWRSGEKTPTFNQIEKVSKATGIPLGYFFLITPPMEDVSFVDYRTIDSLEFENPSRNLIDTLHDMEQVQDWIREYLISEGSKKIDFVGSLNNEHDNMIFAEKVRDLLGIQKEWYKTIRTTEEAFNLLRAAMNDIGVIVMMSGIVANNTHRPLDIKEFRAFAVVDDYAPLIFVNSNDSVNGKLFSLIHELAHICIGENSLFNDRYSYATGIKKTETICNAVAAEILVPTDIFINIWKNYIKNADNEQAIVSLAQFFKCGITVIARKAYDNGFIDYKLYCEIAELAVKQYNEVQKRKKERGSGGDFYRTLASRIDKRFLGMLVNSVNSGRTLYSDAFRLTNTNRSTFKMLIDNVGGGF